ncbi:hypothetical protein E2562_035001 [Oryza meyeriana var. granulata]|uniref:Uncharacterized protein n=1 Tax=Oryza meyeriana var. granulata TaxID=110450 RepID=A0A6G1CVI1_9ORYZ|nr:hypothetical protein E2562_035001 [Oryza meyeriana var. granulata]
MEAMLRCDSHCACFTAVVDALFGPSGFPFLRPPPSVAQLAAGAWIGFAGWVTIMAAAAGRNTMRRDTSGRGKMWSVAVDREAEAR